MLHKLQQRAQDEKGFTLIELLVVILIIGILAAIALPAFLNQKGKGQDAEAKSAARTMQTAMETFYTDNNTYDGATAADLATIEPAVQEIIDDLAGSATGTGNSYTLSATARGTGTVFTITSTDGSVSRTCSAGGEGGCPTGGTW